MSRSFLASRTDHDRLLEGWQDWVLANLFTANYVNSLLVLSSRQDFSLNIPTGYFVKYVQNPGSFQKTIHQLDSELRTALTNARGDLNRVHTGLERAPTHLKTIVLLMKEASHDLLMMLLPDSFDDIEKLVNDSLIILEKPEKSFPAIANLLTEIDYLLSSTLVDQMLSLQVRDIKTQWAYLTELILELARLARRTRDSFILQFSWILQQFLQPGIMFTDANRDFLLSLILSKIVEIDRTSDLLSIVTITYTEISSQFTDLQIGSNLNLSVLTNEDARKRYLKQFRYDLLSQAVQSARLALKRHTEFLQRDATRKDNYDKFLAGTSLPDLSNLLG